LKFKRYQPSTIFPNNEQRTTSNGQPSTINYFPNNEQRTANNEQPSTINHFCE